MDIVLKYVLENSRNSNFWITCYKNNSDKVIKTQLNDDAFDRREIHISNKKRCPEEKPSKNGPRTNGNTWAAEQPNRYDIHHT